MSSPFDVVRRFEEAVADYTGAKYAVTTSSCTMALLLACKWIAKSHRRKQLWMPRHSYVGVPASIINAGLKVRFYDEKWSGGYQLRPSPVYDYARRFTSDMYRAGQYHCISFHSSKICGDTQGGAILHDDDEADAWFRRMRFDGRTEGVDPRDDDIREVGYHCYLSPDVAARLLWKLSNLPLHNHDLPNSNYPDLSTMKAFQ